MRKAGMSGSEFIDKNNTVNCDKAELIGAHIPKSLNNQTFASCSLKRKDQITNLQSLYTLRPQLTKSEWRLTH